MPRKSRTSPTGIPITARAACWPRRQPRSPSRASARKCALATRRSTCSRTLASCASSPAPTARPFSTGLNPSPRLIPARPCRPPMTVPAANTRKAVSTAPTPRCRGAASRGTAPSTPAARTSISPSPMEHGTILMYLPTTTPTTSAMRMTKRIPSPWTIRETRRSAWSAMTAVPPTGIHRTSSWATSPSTTGPMICARI